MISADSRKRKQQDLCDKNGLSIPNTSSWSEFIYSSPSSPSLNGNISTLMDNTHVLNLDSFFDNQISTNYQSGSNSRRHSVAVGELDYHSFDFLKQDMNILPASSWDINFQSLYNESQSTSEKHNHKRSMSLRMDDLNNSLSYSQTTPDSLLFQSNCLDELMSESQNEVVSVDTSVIIGGDGRNLTAETSGTPYSDSNELLSRQSDLLSLTPEDLSLNSTDDLTTSVLANQINTISDWLLQRQEVNNTQEQAHKKQKTRHHSNGFISPVSPEQISCSSLYSLSPSPPITPTQQVSVGFESHSFLRKQMHHTDVEKWDTNGGDISSTNSNNNVPNTVATRVLQGKNTAASMKPLVQDYLIRRDHQERTLPVIGERTVMVLTSKVAQKSYGTEKRFLCPPPTTVLKGANWCTESLDKSNANKQKKGNNFYHSPSSVLSVPKLTIHISGESITQQGTLEWQSSSGATIDNASMINASNISSPVSGRCVSKQLYINDADEKRKRVEVLAKIQLGNGLQLGTFPSKGIKVISKPSKKRQNIKNMELCIHHGTTISLFNRIRSQTVSTKYLGVSNSQQQSNKANGTNATCFVARTGSWDPFVIWLVDTTNSPDTANVTRPNQHHPNNPEFPPPPAIAMQTPSSTQQPVAVHYNQPVVLQCVTTGLVSPVMVIRKVDKGSMVLGGNKTDDLSEKTGGECGDETLGDPVSQLHKVAFQIVQNPLLYHQNKNKLNTGADGRNLKWKLPQSCHPVTYLACLNDVVGMHKTSSTRHFVNTCESASTTTKTTNGQQNTWSELLSKSTNSNGALADVTEDKKSFSGCKFNDTITKSNVRMSAISSELKSGSRRNSLLDSSNGRRGSNVGGSDLSGLEGACWTEDVSDASVWTIVGTDCASYTFWTPSDAPDQSCFNKIFTQQATTTLSNTSAPITPFPLISSQTLPGTKLATTDSSVTSLTLSGENLTRDLMVWFGDIISPRTDYKSRDSITCIVPDTQELMSSPSVQLDDDGLKRKIPLLLVRGDGVVYRTNQFYVF